jgi:hypothetical protein
MLYNDLNTKLLNYLVLLLRGGRDARPRARPLAGIVMF